MAEKRKLDFFDIFVFDRDEEEEGLTTEPQEEHVPLIDLTVDSDEDDASNSAVIQRKQPQRQEPATDEDDSTEDEASSSSRRRAVKTGARSRGRKSKIYSLETITFSQLEQKEKKGAQRVLDFYRDDRREGFVHICSRFMSGKCDYMTKNSTSLSNHMKSSHPNAKHPGYKITEYPGFKDFKANDFVTKPYSELKKTDPQLAEEILALYKRPQNKNRKKVHLCGHFVRGKCQYFSIRTGRVKGHMARKHSRTFPMIKIVGCPGERVRTYHEYEQMTYAELKSKRSKVADEVLTYYYGQNRRQKVHLCGSCDYFSKDGYHVREHIGNHHPPTTRVYKIIEYPRLE